MSRSYGTRMRSPLGAPGVTSTVCAATSNPVTSPRTTLTSRRRLKMARSGMAISSADSAPVADLICERLEQVEVTPVDQRDLRARPAQMADGLEPAEAPTHDHDPKRPSGRRAQEREHERGTNRGQAGDDEQPAADRVAERIGAVASSADAARGGSW